MSGNKRKKPNRPNLAKRRPQAPAPQAAAPTARVAARGPLLIWLVRIGAGSTLLGGVGLITSYFWWSVGFVYAGLLLVLMDLWMEKFSQKWVPWLISLALIGGGTAFGAEVVFKKAPVTIDANVITIPHFPGSTFGGITWYDPMASDLRVWIRNPSSINYDDVDLVVDTDAYIIGDGQLQSVPECKVALSNEAQTWATEEKSGEKHVVTPPISSTLGMGYRVLCGKFPARSAIQLIFAITDKPKAPGITVGAVANPNNGARNPSTQVTVEGTYKAVFQTRTIKEKVNVKVQK